MTSLRKSRATGGDAPLRRTAEAHLFLRVRDSRGVSGGIGDRGGSHAHFSGEQP